ncbi:hypothetical protein C2W62_25565 [Candidatus Entotheonella serta]|nr:hypothetical protein C2W62_25565 [Candidatus Entotheonella serta]
MTKRLMGLALSLGMLAAVGFVLLPHVWAQIPVDGEKIFHLVIYNDRSNETGQVFRDRAGDIYTEHWVLFPNYDFDQAREPGAWLRVEAMAGRGYDSTQDFLDRVPFLEGSRYIRVEVQEFDQLPSS